MDVRREVTLWHWYHIIPPFRIYCMTILLLIMKLQVIEKCCKQEIFKGYVTDNTVCIEVCLKCTSTNISWDVLVPLLDDRQVWSPELVPAVEFSVQVLHCFWQAFVAHLQLLQVWNKQQKQWRQLSYKVTNYMLLFKDILQYSITYKSYSISYDYPIRQHFSLCKATNQWYVLGTNKEIEESVYSHLNMKTFQCTEINFDFKY